MKYKNIDLELPPLGEVLTTLDNEGNIVLGYYYLIKEERKFHGMFSFPRCLSISQDFNMIGPCSRIVKWAKMPKLKTLKKERPPIGIEVLMASVSKYGRGYVLGVNIKDYVLEDRVDDRDGRKAKIDAWLEAEAFEEDKE